MDEEKDEFFKEFGQDYGYPNAPKNIDEIRASEFKRLDGLVYLDHAGSTLYSELQMQEVFKDLSNTVYGNPHSQSDSSSATSDVIKEARQQVLDYCNASPEEYKCIFTSGATAALKLVGESFPWSCESCFMYSMENHNSVLGIREYALNEGAAALAVDIEDCKHLTELPTSSVKIFQRQVQRRSQDRSAGISDGAVHNLFAFPSECNFSGVKFDLNLVNIIKERADSVMKGSTYCSNGQWKILIDAAKGCATQPPDLSKFPADFIVISFYKIFGYPTGLGALLARKDAAELLRRTYFSGGTVAASIADIDYWKRKGGIEESFEDGSQSFLCIAALKHGFKIVNTLKFSAIARHTTSLATFVRRKLSGFRYNNGMNVCTVYGQDIAEVFTHELGPTITFNLKRLDGSWYGYREVEKLASLWGIHLRTGCFCNPGACSKYIGLSHSDLLSNLEAGHVCWDDQDILHGKPTGAVRISFGYMSTFEDAKAFLNFVREYFILSPNVFGNQNLMRTKTISSQDVERTYLPEPITLKSIIVYPIKSCAGIVVGSWPLSKTGLQHDREWLLRDSNGEVLTQKKVPDMRLIIPSIDFAQGLLVVESSRCKSKLLIGLEPSTCSHIQEEIHLYGQRYEVQRYEIEVDLWFTEAIGRPCRLMRNSDSQNIHCDYKNGRAGICRDVQSKLNFANEAQLLLVSEESVSDLNGRIISNARARHDSLLSIHVTPMRFRPNIVVSGGVPYAEDNWRSLTIGKEHFTSLGGCNRCQMINIDPATTERALKSKDPLATLASYRRKQGKILFGTLLKYETNMSPAEDEGMDGERRIQVGQLIYPSTY